MENNSIRRVYVWELPVRVYHWLNALAVTVLAVTGYMIGKPVSVPMSGEASFSYWFGWVRFVHFVAAFVFFFNFLARIYWGFVGNQYARWDNFLPLSRKLVVRQVNEAIDVIWHDILHGKTRAVASVGHNSLAGWTYFLSFLAFLFQSV